MAVAGCRRRAQLATALCCGTWDGWQVVRITPFTHHTFTAHTFKSHPARALERRQWASLGLSAGVCGENGAAAFETSMERLLDGTAAVVSALPARPAPPRLQLALPDLRNAHTLTRSGRCLDMSGKLDGQPLWVCRCRRRRRRCLTGSSACPLLRRLTGFRDALCFHRCVVYFVHDPRILVRGRVGPAAAKAHTAGRASCRCGCSAETHQPIVC